MLPRPNDTLTIESFVPVLKERPRCAKLLVAGDFKMKLLEPEGVWRGEDTAAALSKEVFEDMSEHLLPRRHSWCRDERTWSMIQAGRWVRSRTDYIMGTDHRLFWNVSVWDHNQTKYTPAG